MLARLAFYCGIGYKTAMGMGRGHIFAASTQCAGCTRLARCHRYTVWRLYSEYEIECAIEAESTEVII